MRTLNHSKNIGFYLLLAMLCFGVFQPLDAAITSKGKEFWLTFPKGNTEKPVSLQLLISSDLDTNVQVEIPTLGFNSFYFVGAGSMVQVSLPGGVEVTQVDGVASLAGIHVTADNQVSVAGLRYESQGTDGYLGLPVEALDKDYMILTYYNQGSLRGSEFAVVATQDCTQLTITPRFSSGGHPANTPYSVFLANRGDVYQFQNLSDLLDASGTAVVSDKPVAVFGAHICMNIPGTSSPCNYLVEQLWPTRWWGSKFVAVPLFTRSGDTFRFLSATNATSVTVNGGFLATLNRGFTREITSTSALHVTSNNPIYVMQYSNSSDVDLNLDADPFMASVPPTDKYSTTHSFSVPVSAFSGNYENIIVPNAGTGAVTVDGVRLSPASFTIIPGSGFSGVQISTGPGFHQVSAGSPVGVLAYGYNQFDGYGYPAGLFFSTETPVPTSTPGGSCGTSTPTPTDSPTPSLTPTQTSTATPSRTPTESPTPSLTPSLTSTSSLTPSPTETPTLTVTLTFTPTGSITPTFTQTPTETSTPTITPTLTSTFSPTATRTFTSTLTATFTSTMSGTATPTATSTHTRTPTASPTFTRSLTATFTSSNTPTVTSTPTETSTPGCFIHHWPDPFDPNSAHNGELKVSCLPPGATVSFYTVSGEWVNRERELGGIARWKGRNAKGMLVSPGIYFYVVESGSNVLMKGKFIVTHAY